LLKRDFSDIVYRALANYFDVQVINSNIKRQGLKVLEINLELTTTVLAGDNEIITIQPPQGKIWKVARLIQIHCPAISTATSGDQTIRFYDTWINYEGGGIEMKSATTGEIWYGYGQPISYADYKPNDLKAFNELVRNFYADYDHPFTIKYYNNTDVDQTGTRRIKFIVIEFDKLS